MIGGCTFVCFKPCMGLCFNTMLRTLQERASMIILSTKTILVLENMLGTLMSCRDRG